MPATIGDAVSARLRSPTTSTTPEAIAASAKKVYPIDQMRLCCSMVAMGSMSSGYPSKPMRLPALEAA